MIQSMTGYARTVANNSDAALSVEIRSVNHRTLDVKLRSRKERSLGFDGMVRALISKHVHRGSVEVLIETGTGNADSQAHHALDLSTIAHYYENLKSAQKILGLEDKITLRDLFVFPDVLQKGDRADSAMPDWGVVEPLLREACLSLVRERQREGAHLLDQVSGLVRDLRKAVDEIERIQPRVSQESQTRIRERVHQALMGVSLDTSMNQRVAQEVVLAVERSDTSEEIHRLKGHLNHVSELLGVGGVVGRKLEFMVQEILREINTVGSKSIDLEVSRLAIHAKTLADQVREQVSNLE